MAICLAVSHLSPSNKDIIVLNVFRSLQSISIRSPKVILFLLKCISSLIERKKKSIISHHYITLVWCPEHKGSALNEKADNMEKVGPYMCQSVPWISVQYLCSEIKESWVVEKDFLWINSDYEPSFHHL